MEGFTQWPPSPEAIGSLILTALTYLLGRRRGWWSTVANEVSRHFNLERDNINLRIKVRYLEATLNEQNGMIDALSQKAERAALLTGLLESTISTDPENPPSELPPPSTPTP